MLDFFTGLKKRTTREFFRLVKKIPAIKRKIEEELSKTRKDIEDSMNKSIKGSNYLQNLPLKGFTEVSMFLLCVWMFASMCVVCMRMKEGNWYVSMFFIKASLIRNLLFFFI